jgi:septum formation protein
MIATSHPLVLASTSTYRSDLLRRLGVDFQAVDPDYQEEHDLDLPPEKLVVELAVRKAKSLADRHPDSLIIGSDQVVELDGRILFKPGTIERAKSQLTELSGRTHRLLTGLVVFEPASERLETTLDIHHMTLWDLSAEEIDEFVELEKPIDCAGAYKVEGPGIALFKSMTGDDYTGIIGLPLTKLVALLKRFD